MIQYTNSSELQSCFQSEGYVILRNVIDEGLARQLYHSTIHLASKYKPSFPQHLLNASPWVDGEFNKQMIALRNETPALFGAVYDCLQTSLIVQQITCTPRIAAIAAELLNDDVSNLSATGHMIRMDVPEDKRNALEWHQESFYYTQNLKGENGLVLWFPLHNLTESHGPVIVCPGSHKEGALKIESKGKSDYGTSEQFCLPQDLIDKYQQLSVAINLGDALFFNMDLFHRSGWNQSKSIRFCAGVRFHRMVTDDFLPGRSIYKASEKVGRLCDAPKS